MRNARKLAAVFALIVIASTLRGQPQDVYRADVFEAFNLGPIHGQNAGTWNPAIPNVPTDPGPGGAWYRHWQAKSGTAVITTYPGKGKVLQINSSPSVWLQMDWQGVASAGYYHDAPTQLSIEFDFLIDAGSGSSLDVNVKTYRDLQQVEG